MAATIPWSEKGCAVCRAQWERGDPPPMLATDIANHTHLHRCVACGTYWEQHERYADSIDAALARKRYPAVFPAGQDDAAPLRHP